MFGKVYAAHLIRVNPWPEPVDRAFKKFNAQIYNTMQGPNEFVISGNFKNWDRWADLPKIKVPTRSVQTWYLPSTSIDFEPPVFTSAPEAAAAMARRRRTWRMSEW